LQEEVKRLRAEKHRLQRQLRYQQRRIDEGYFGSSTPSAKKPFKANTKTERNNGGGRVGHRGHGRTMVAEQQADAIIPVDTEPLCPDCQVPLKNLGTRDRTLTEVVPVEVKKVVYKFTRRRCPACRRILSAKAPSVLPKFKQSNSLLAYAVTEHYFHQVPFGHLAKRLGISESSLIAATHRLAQLFKIVPDKLILEYRQAPVRHADETGWRNDGRNGYAWIFVTTTLTIFRLRLTRAASVAKEIFGHDPLLGHLIVDRYPVYQTICCRIQYCYAHLLRAVKDLGQEFPNHPEVQDFVSTAAALLTQAIKLRTLPITDTVFYQRADQLKGEIQLVMHSPARQAGIQKIQNIFREHAHRLYHWAEDRAIPADNNFAERELRKLVIARKISFGSQSDAGAKTREILMTTLLTLQKRKSGDVMSNFKAALDALACDPKRDPYQALFSSNTS
jgi:transposase